MTSQTTRSTAVVPLERAARYGKQLTSHLGRRSESAWSPQDQAGWIDLRGHRATVVADEETLTLTVTAPAADLDRLEDVLGRHLVRFVTGAEAVVAWEREDGSAGTTQEGAATPPREDPSAG